MNPKQLPISIPVSIARPHTVVGADAMLLQAKQGIAGLKDRIAGIDLPETPAAYIGPTPVFTFNPEPTSFLLDTAQNGSSSVAVNYIVKSGTTYMLPVIVGGNGIFLAHRFRIVIWQRFNVAGTTIRDVAQGAVAPIVNSFDGAVYWTTKFSLYAAQPVNATSVLGAVLRTTPMINYRWNIQDPVMGTLYSDNLLPATTVLNRHWVDHKLTLITGPGPAALYDGDWHEFDAPWRFDKAYQMNVMFRPLTDIVQFDSSISGTVAAPNGPGLAYDDRVSGVRNQAVTVQVEFQGERVGGS